MTIRDEFELDLSPAESSLDSFGAAIDSVVSEFETGLAQALEVLQTPIVPEVDISAAEAEISGLGSEDVNIAVEGDVTDIEAEIAGLGGETVTVDVEADASGIEEVGSAAASAEGSVTDLAGAADTLSASTTLATESAIGLGSALEVAAAVLPIKAGLAGAAIGGLAVATDGFFDAAVNAEAATLRYTQTLGVFAEQVNTIDVGNISIPLTELNASLGSGTAQVRNAISSFFQLGHSAGINGELVATASEQLVAMSARAVALNPALGSVGDVAETMGLRIARGGRFAAQLGVSLTKAEIQKRGEEMFGFGRALTQAELSIAALDLATTKYGDTLEQDIARASENPIIQLRQLSLELKRTAVELGRPLIAPVFDILDSIQPVLVSVLTLTGELAEAFTIFSGPLLAALGPVVTQGLEPVIAAVQIIQPALASFGGAIGDLITALSPLTAQFGEQFAGFITLMDPVLDALSAVIRVLATVTGFITDGLDALGPFGDAIVAMLNPLGGLVGALGEVSKLLGLTEENTTAADNALTSLTDKVFGAVDGASSFAKGYEALLDTLETGIIESTGGTFSEFSEEMGKAGVNARDFAEIITAGGAKLDDLKTALEDAGVASEVIDEIVEGARGQAEVFGNVAAAQLDELVALGLLTQAERDHLDVQFGLNTTTADYRSALEEVSVQLAEKEARELAAAAAEGTATGQALVATGAFNQLADAVLAGQVNTGNLAVVADQLGIPIEAATGFVNTLKDSMKNFADGVVNNLPSALELINGIDDATNPQIVIDNLNQQAVAFSQFGENLQFLIDTVGPQFAQLAAQAGPQFTQQITDGIRSGDPEIAAALNESLATFDTSLTGLNNRLLNEIAPQLGFSGATMAEAINTGFGTTIVDPVTGMPATSGAAASSAQGAIGGAVPGMTTEGGELAGGANTGYEQGINLDEPSRKAVESAIQTLQVTFVALQFTANLMALLVGGSIGANLVGGIEGAIRGATLPGGSLDAAAREMVTALEAIIRAEAQSESPSRLFAAIGADLIGGLGLGIEQSTPTLTAPVLGVMESISGPLEAGFVGVSGAGSSSNSFSIVNHITVPPGVSDPASFGATVGDSAGDKIIRKVRTIVGKT